MRARQLLGFSRFPSQHLEESWSDYWAEKNQSGSKICTHKKNQASASGPR